MSRSYKKTPINKSAPKGNIGQKFANRRVRRIKGEIPDGSWYKKVYCQYDIHDWITRQTLEDELRDRERTIHDVEHGISRWGWVRTELDPDEADINLCIQRWKKFYYRK